MMEYFEFSSSEDFKVVYLSTKCPYELKFVRNCLLHIQIKLSIIGYAQDYSSALILWPWKIYDFYKKFTKKSMTV